MLLVGEKKLFAESCPRLPECSSTRCAKDFPVRVSAKNHVKQLQPTLHGNEVFSKPRAKGWRWGGAWGFFPWVYKLTYDFSENLRMVLHTYLSNLTSGSLSSGPPLSYALSYSGVRVHQSNIFRSVSSTGLLVSNFQETSVRKSRKWMAASGPTEPQLHSLIVRQHASP